MSDDTQITRQWLVLRASIARRHGICVREMARDMGVTQRTIRRDLETLRRAGFPIKDTNGVRGREAWRLSDNGKMPPLSLTSDETVVLHLVCRLLGRLAGTQLREATQSTPRKIRATVSESVLKNPRQPGPNRVQSVVADPRGMSDQTAAPARHRILSPVRLSHSWCWKHVALILKGFDCKAVTILP